MNSLQGLMPDLNSSLRLCGLPCCDNCTDPSIGIDCKYFKTGILNCSVSATSSLLRSSNFTCNTTNNSNYPNQQLAIDDGARIAFLVAYSLVLVVGVPGNLIVCFILGMFKITDSINF